MAEGSGRISELYDPETGQWTDMAVQEYWRVYHSTALLLADGRVASLGGNPEQGVYEQRIEIYSPSYLYTSNGTPAPRPTMTGVPAQIAYAAAFEVTTAAPGAIREAVLMRPISTNRCSMSKAWVTAPDRCRGGRGTDKVASCQRIVTR